LIFLTSVTEVKRHVEHPPESLEKLGPQARLQIELTKLESRNRDVWLLVALAAAVLVLGILSFLMPTRFWAENVLEIRIPPQVLFVIMLVVVVGALYMSRREVEMQKLRLANLQQTLAAQSEYSASMVDSLTHVFSRKFLRDLLQGEISRAERNKRPLGLVMCDIDNFKHVNDRYGHLMGDYVLAQIASILKSCVRGSDFVIRYGGDEFLIILSETEEPGAQIVLGRIRQKVADWDSANRLGELPITVSLGLHHHVPGQSAEQDIATADTLLYKAKEAIHGPAAEPAASARNK